MKVVISGGTGFLGRYLVQSCLCEGWEPVILSRSSVADDFGCTVRVTDYTQRSLSSALLGCDAFVHLAARRKLAQQFEDYYQDMTITQVAYDSCLARGVSNIVYASTISVYSDEDQLPWTEKTLPKPYGLYGISKLTNEHLGSVYSKKYGLGIKNLRLSHLFGFNEKNNYMVNLFMRQAFRQEELSVEVPCVAKREFLYAKDAANGIIAALRKQQLSGTFNVSGSSYFSNIEVANLINDVFGNQHLVKCVKRGGDDLMKSSYMSGELAYAKLGFRPAYSMKSALEEIYQQMKELPNVPSYY